MPHAFIPIQAIDEQGRSMLRLAQLVNELQPTVRALYPGYELQIVKIEDEKQPELLPVTLSERPNTGFKDLSGPDKIAFILESGPMEKDKLLKELDRRGTGMTPDTLTVYLSRGKRAGRFDNAPGAVWGLKKDITNGLEHFPQ
jgi:hypothetical protein